MRRPEWKQDNPQDQLVAILDAIRGDLSALEENINSPAKFELMDHNFRSCIDLADMVTGSWDGKERDPEWKQANPRDQLIAILGAARWTIEAMEMHHATSRNINKADNLLDDCVKLSRMVQGSWE